MTRRKPRASRPPPRARTRRPAAGPAGSWRPCLCFTVGSIVANQNASLLIRGGVRLELSPFLAVVQWFFAYRMRVASRQLERRLGVGER